MGRPEVGPLLERGNPERNHVDLSLESPFVEAVPCGVGHIARGVALGAHHFVNARFEEGAREARKPPRLLRDPSVANASCGKAPLRSLFP